MKKVVVKPQATGTIRALLGERKLVIGLLVGFALLSVAYNRSSEIMYAGELIRHQASPLSDPSVSPLYLEFPTNSTLSDTDASGAPEEPEQAPKPPENAAKEALEAEPALLEDPVTEERSRDDCAQALGVPKVALLFLAKENIWLHESWRLWFQSASGVLPIRSLQKHGCSRSTVTLPEACRGRGVLASTEVAEEDIIAQQSLFSVFVHVPPEVNEAKIAPLFRNHVLPRRTMAKWGSMRLVYAARLLMHEAFKDPANQRFLLVSESDLPLFDPVTMHYQAISESLSRISACPSSSVDRYRWNKRLKSAVLKTSHWRKASQWFLLTREHARVVLGDTHVYRQFEKYCYPGYDPSVHRARSCYGDEHYMPTLLAVHGLQQSENCDVRGVAAAEWRGGAHPVTYKTADLEPDLIHQIRTKYDQCPVEETRAIARRAYLTYERDEPDREWDCGLLAPQYYPIMDPLCSLTMRKVSNESASHVAETLFRGSCANGLGLIAPALCDAGPEAA